MNDFRSLFPSWFVPGATAAAAVSLLAACGGGGGSDPTPPFGPSPTLSASAVALEGTTNIQP
jgi:hypothetical protein